jgi:hypothetical protein
MTTGAGGKIIRAENLMLYFQQAFASARLQKTWSSQNDNPSDGEPL